MRRIGSVALVAILCVVFSMSPALAAQNMPRANPPGNGERNNGAQPGKVTQCELAGLLVEVLGLARFLPAAPSCQQRFEILLHNSISPAEGWNPDAIVTKATLARVIVQAMKKQSEIGNPDDPKVWIDYLKSIGVPIDTVGEAVSNVDPLAEPVAPNFMSAKVDPLVKRHRFNPLDETQYGVDMEQITRVFSFVDFHFLPPVTPD
jgi:hypothetical protein